MVLLQLNISCDFYLHALPRNQVYRQYMAQKSLFSTLTMPALAYLFASQNEIPAKADNAWFESACTWIHAISSAWDRLAKNFPAGDKLPEPDYKNLSTNMANMPPGKCREIATQADEAAKKILQIWKDTGAMPAIDAGLIAELTGLQSKISTDYLAGYRGGFKSIPKQKLKRGARDAFLMISSAPFEFKIMQSYSAELHILSEISRAHGADALALWTWGSTIGLLLAKNSTAGARPQFFGPLHISARARSEGHIARLLKDLHTAFNGSRFQPDWSSIEAQLRAADLSVSKWFAAFGLPGAPENSPANANALWESWERASQAILTGKRPDGQDAKAIKAALEQTGEKLSTKPAKGDGGVAYPLAGVGLSLARTNSWPEDSIWQRRARAAELYGAIANDGVAEWLTVGVDSKNLGGSASLGRLLQVYPAEFRKDRLWAMQSVLVAEAWNGHAFVEPLAVLAEGIDIQLALVLYPASAREAFRKEFGLEGGDDSSNRQWEAEAFIETKTWPKQKPSKLLPGWIEKQRLNAVLIVTGLHSTIKVWSQGKETTADPAAIGLGHLPSGDELARAARDLDVRPLLAPLAQSALLKPPPLNTEIQFAPAKRVEAMKALTATVPVITLAEAPGNFSSASTPAVEGADYKTKRLICLQVTGLETPKIFAGDLAALLGKGSDVWQKGENVCACSESIPDWKLLAGLLGDAATGASLTVVNTDGIGFRIMQG